jgi:hypothetical protein
MYAIIHTIIFGMPRNILSEQKKTIVPVEYSNIRSLKARYVLIASVHVRVTS